MTRVASLFLPQLAIERLRRIERPNSPPDRARAAPATALPLPVDDNPGACSVPRGGGWRPGARWARDGTTEDLPAHQRPSMREMGRRSEAAPSPFRPARGDEGGAAVMPPPALPPLWGLKPRILIAREGQRDIVTAACPLAQDLGLAIGMAAAHARALVPDLEVGDAEPSADAAWLDRLAHHAVRHWTPTAAAEGANGLWLDLTGTTHLFGGEQRFCRRAIGFLQRLGFTAHIAIAGTPGAAHALARYSGHRVTILEPGTETQGLADLPLAALRLSPEALVTAARFGIERIADLYAMPRGPLARRLGLKTVERLDQARGLAPEPIQPLVPFETPVVERRLVEPIATAEAIAKVIGDLVDDMVEMLEQRGLGLRAAALACVRVDAAEQIIPLGASRATRDAKHIKRMFALRIERIEPGLGIEAMRLAAPQVEPLGATTIASDLIPGDRPPDIAPLVDQLAGRVGDAALFRLSAIESDVPERAVRALGPLAEPQGWPKWKRPTRLLVRPEHLHGVVALLPDHPPRRFTWRGKPYRVVGGDGPERIHGEWWKNGREMWAVRDYFKVEADSGERFWIFRRGDGFEAETGDLSWYMHGVFG